MVHASPPLISGPLTSILLPLIFQTAPESAET